MNKLESDFSTLPAVKPRSRWRTLRTLLVICASLTTVVALFYAEENWRGRRAWLAYQRHFETGGRTPDLKGMVATPVPDDQNFAMTPFFKPLSVIDPATPWWTSNQTMNLVLAFGRLLEELPRNNRAALKPVVSANLGGAMGDWRRGRSRDIVAAYMVYKWDTNNLARSAPGFDPANVTREQAAHGILENLAMVDPILAEIRSAAARPYNRFTDFHHAHFPGSVLLPYLGPINHLARLASYRASAELALDESDDAMLDALVILRLAESIRDERTEISQLVRANVVTSAIQPIWEGLAAHLWTEAQLKRLQDVLLKVDLPTQFRLALEGDRQMGNAMIEALRPAGNRQPNLDKFKLRNRNGDDEELFGFIPVDLLPQGWFYFEQLEYNRLFDLLVGPGPEPGKARVNPRRVTTNQLQIQAALSATNRFAAVWHHRVLPRMLLANLLNFDSELRIATVQTAVEQAAIACALERHRIDKGGYPETLDVLTPAFATYLPPDVVTGESYKYRRNPDGTFVLYSVGWNLQDDRGTLSNQGWKYLGMNPKKDDWVWFSSRQTDP